MQTSTFKYKIKFFLSHLAISSVIALVSLYLVFYVWYPSPLDKALGVTHIFLLILAIDTILGPLLTLLVVKEGKKTLKMDLAVIAVLQLLAFSYGISTVAVTRPVYITYDAVRFDAIRANDVYEHKGDKYYLSKIFSGPQFVAIKNYHNEQERQERVELELEKGIAPSMRESLYETIDTKKADLVRNSEALEQLYDFNNKKVVDKTLQKYPNAKGWYALKAYDENMVVLVAENKIVDIVDLRPW